MVKQKSKKVASQQHLAVYKTLSNNVNAEFKDCEDLIDVLSVKLVGDNKLEGKIVVNINKATFEVGKDAMLQYVLGGTLYKGYSITFVAEFWVNPRQGYVDLHFINAMLTNIQSAIDKTTKELK